MDFDTLYPNKFMKAGEFNGKDFVFTIASVKLEELGEGKEKENKAIVSFEKTKKLWVMNKTNGLCLKAMFGRETNQWIGKRVALFPTQINDPFTGQLTLAIRVRGSPDIDADISFSARLGRKQADFKLFKTIVKGAAKKAEPAPVKAPEPVPEEGFGEPPDDLLLPGQDGYAP